MALNLAELLEKLDSVDRFNLTYRDKEGKDYTNDIKDAEELIKDTGINPSMKELILKIGMWYLFSERNKDKSLHYFSSYLNLISDEELNTFTHAQVKTFIGYANTINPNFQDSQLFTEAIFIYERLKERTQNSEEIKKIDIEWAFAKRYLGLCHHRKFENEPAQEAYTAEGKIYDKYQGEQKILNDYAENQHLLGVSYAREKKFSLANDHLKKAHEIERKFEALHGQHFLRWITEQSIADVQRQLAIELLSSESSHQEESADLLKSSIEMLKKTFAEQKERYGEKHLDVAKTIQFLGYVYRDSKNYLQATEYLLKALAIKSEIYSNADRKMVELSKNDLLAFTTIIEKNCNAIPEIHKISAMIQSEITSIEKECKKKETSIDFAEIRTILAAIQSKTGSSPGLTQRAHMAFTASASPSAASATDVTTKFRPVT